MEFEFSSVPVSVNAFALIPGKKKINTRKKILKGFIEQN
jgi:hypothetical protein